MCAFLTRNQTSKRENVNTSRKRWSDVSIEVFLSLSFSFSFSLSISLYLRHLNWVKWSRKFFHFLLGSIGKEVCTTTVFTCMKMSMKIHLKEKEEKKRGKGSYTSLVHFCLSLFTHQWMQFYFRLLSFPPLHVTCIRISILSLNFFLLLGVCAMKDLVMTFLSFSLSFLTLSSQFVFSLFRSTFFLPSLICYSSPCHLWFLHECHMFIQIKWHFIRKYR